MMICHEPFGVEIDLCEALLPVIHSNRRNKEAGVDT
jgi:hypothetical protein